MAMYLYIQDMKQEYWSGCCFCYDVYPDFERFIIQMVLWCVTTW